MSDACLYRCRIAHGRPAGPRYHFAYSAYYLLLDIDRIDASCRRLRLMSRNRFNLLGFYDRDHGARDGGNLRSWVEAILADQGIAGADGRIQLLCLPRVLGYVFNPISLYYCERGDGALQAVICEVHNTFGEQHCYVLHADGAPMDLADTQRKTKLFHVSPLFDRSGEYRFRLSRPGARIAVNIRLYAADASLRLTTALTGEARPLTDRNLLALFVRIPLVTVKIMAAIHWQALKIWLRGARFHAKPDQHGNRNS